MASDSASSGMPGWLIALIIVTTLTAVVIGVYMSPVGEDVTKWVMEKYFKAEATAAEKALEKAGETKAEGFMYVASGCRLCVHFWRMLAC